MVKDSAQPTTPAKHVQTLQGVVVRRSGDKTVAVAVQRVSMHPLYRKRTSVTKKYLAHDERNEANVGDTVTIRSSRPLSARKRWAVVSVTGRTPISE